MEKSINSVSRVLIVGFGSIGRRHAQILRSHFSWIELAVLRHSSCKDSTSQDLGIQYCYSSVEEALQFSPDVVLIANPASYHVEAALPMASAGVHLFIEKPLSNSIESIDQLIGVVEKSGTHLMVGYNLRFVRSLQVFRDLLLEGYIGKIVSAHAEVGQYLPSWRKDGDYREQVSAKKELGGGVLLELSHELDYLLWIFGKPKWVFADIGHSGVLDIDVEDVVKLLMGFSVAQQNTDFAVSVSMDFLRHDTGRGCVVIGSEGTLKWNAVAGQVTVLRKGEREWDTLYVQDREVENSYALEWEHILHCIAENERPMVDVFDGMEVLKVIDAVRLSNANKKRISLN